MAPPQMVKRLSSASSQYTTQNPRLSTSTTNPNIFSDEFAMEPLGPHHHSPSPSSSESESPLDTSSDTTRQPASNHQQPNMVEDPSQKRRSATENEGFGGLRREGSSALRTAHRTNAGSLSEASKGSISNTTAFAMPRTQSPYQGSTGPSHPYGMYPQGIGLSRNPSSATNASVRVPERTYPATGGPSQPYGMYSQNTVPEDEISPVEEITQQMQGFPGREGNYQRRFGPDSDEAADIVGPDGYTEQLPAYTRYANDIPPKTINPAPEIPRGEPSNQPGESRITLNTVTSEESNPRSPAVDDSTTQLGTAAGDTNLPHLRVTPPTSEATPSSSEGGHFKERIKERGKKRICFGKLPLWLCMVTLIVVACSIGAVIGGVFGRAKARFDHATSPHSTFSIPTVTSTITTTSLVDAEPISSAASNIPTLIPGDWQVPLEHASEILDQCLQDPDQKFAWGCTSGATMQMEIKTVDLDPVVRFSYENEFGAYDESLSDVRFGAQPPIMDDFTSMSLMKASDHLDKGPAYVFHKQFDKLVILPEDTFQTPKTRRRRNDESHNVVYTAGANFTPAVYAPIGHKPWYCYWNRTLLEGFIFVDTDVASINNTSITLTHSITVKVSVTPSSTPISTVGIPVTPSSLSSRAVENSVTPPSSPTQFVELSATPPTFSSSVSTTFFSPIETSFEPSWTQSSNEHLSSTPIPEPPSLPPTELADESEGHNISQSLSPRQVLGDSSGNLDGSLDTSMNTYPKVIKIEERRNFETEVQPYCQQMLIMEDRTVQDLGLPRIDLTVEEAEEVQSRRFKNRRGFPRIVPDLRKRGEKSACWCEWIIDGTWEEEGYY